MLISSISGIPSNAGQSPGTSGNLHLTHLSLCLICTEHLPSYPMFDRFYVLSANDLFIMEFNSTIVDLSYSILNIWNGIKFQSLPVSLPSFGLYMTVV